MEIEINFDYLNPFNYSQEEINTKAKREFDKIMLNDYQQDSKIPIIFGGIDYPRNFKVLGADFLGMDELIIKK